MAWQLSSQDDLPHLIELLKLKEWRHVAFSSRIYEKRTPSLPNPHRMSVYLNRTESGLPREALLVSRGGEVLPVLAESDPGVRSDISTLIGETRPLHSVMGLKRDVDTIQRSVDRRIRAVVDYHLMVLPIEAPLLPADETASDLELKFRRARPRDLLALFPLQREYEKEEVLIDPSRFNSTAAYLNLQHHLKRDLIYFAVRDGQIVAKAGTNARGIGYDQLGGVYTIRPLRSIGVGTALVRHLVNELRRRGRHVCLFVKRDNPAALRLYRKLGFVRKDEFRIAYYFGHRS